MLMIVFRAELLTGLQVVVYLYFRLAGQSNLSAPYHPVFTSGGLHCRHLSPTDKYRKQTNIARIIN